MFPASVLHMNGFLTSDEEVEKSYYERSDVMRFEPAPQMIQDMYVKLRNEHFNNLANVNVLLLLDTKKKLNKGKLCLGYIKKASDIVQFLTTEEAPEEGYHFVICLDKKMVEHCEEADIERTLRHEMRHIFISERGKLGLLPHDYEDFISEIEMNHDDPNWHHRVAETVYLMYEQEADEE
jgi:hypothetical protein